MNLSRLSTERLRELAGALMGEIWKPHIEVSHEDADDAYYWQDLAECPRGQWRGPFKTERGAWLNALSQYAIPDEATKPGAVYIKAAFMADGQIIGAVAFRHEENIAGSASVEAQARRALREIAARNDMKLATYETLPLGEWLDAGQVIELDVGLNICHENTP